MFRSSHFLFLVTFGDKVMKILRNLCLHFARQDGQDGKKWKENHATKVTKIPKTKRRKYGMNKTKVNGFPISCSGSSFIHSLGIFMLFYSKRHNVEFF